MTTQKSDEMVVLADHVDIETNDKIQTKAMPPQKDPQIIYIIYLSAAAVVGACLRAYLGRFFGGDCEDQTIYDFLTPVSSKICLTTSGRALQTGGALFRDLPANVLGSFIMGLVSSKKIKIPWFHKNHALQKDDVFHVMISTGLCGSLTTFASWNTQMIVMMDGTFCQLGSQSIISLLGYLFGFMLATSSFEFGRQVSGYLYVWKHPSDDATEESEQVTSTEDTRICGCCRHSAVLSSNGIVKQPILQPKLFIVFFALMVLALFVIGNIVYEIQFYRNMILLWLFAPLGALMRWKLSKWNSINNRRIFTRRLQWLPLGTLCANLLGSIFSIVCMGLLDRLQNKEEYVFDSWSIAVLFAVQTGFAGSLSTVSSFVKEVAFLSDDHPNNVKSHLYAVITCTSAIVLGLIIYMPMARI